MMTKKKIKENHLKIKKIEMYKMGTVKLRKLYKNFM